MSSPARLKELERQRAEWELADEEARRLHRREMLDRAHYDYNVEVLMFYLQEKGLSIVEFVDAVDALVRQGQTDG